MQTTSENTVTTPGAAVEPERGLRFSAVAMGVIADLVASLVFWSVLGGILGITLAVSGMPADEIGAVTAAKLTGLPGAAITMALGLLGSAVGGFVAARMGAHAPQRHAIMMGACSLVLAVLLWGVGGSESPWPWLEGTAFVLTIPAAVAGSFLVQRRD